MTGFDKLKAARKFLLNELLSEIKDEYFDDERPFLKITFFKGLVLYIRYNDCDEYLYNLVIHETDYQLINKRLETKLKNLKKKI